MKLHPLLSASLLLLSASLLLLCTTHGAFAADMDPLLAVADQLAGPKAWTIEQVTGLTNVAVNGTAVTRYDSTDIADRKPFRRVSLQVKPTKGRRWVRSVTLQLADSEPPVPFTDIVAKYGPPKQADDGREVIRRKHDWLVCTVDTGNMVRTLEITRLHQRHHKA